MSPSLKSFSMAPTRLAAERGVPAIRSRRCARHNTRRELIGRDGACQPRSSAPGQKRRWQGRINISGPPPRGDNLGAGLDFAFYTIADSCAATRESFIRSPRPRRQGERPVFRYAALHFGPVYSITSSAPTSTLSGIEIPSVFAAFKFTTTSNNAGCSTGKSAVCSPFSSLSTKCAARR